MVHVKMVTTTEARLRRILTEQERRQGIAPLLGCAALLFMVLLTLATTTFEPIVLGVAEHHIPAETLYGFYVGVVLLSLVGSIASGARFFVRPPHSAEELIEEISASGNVQKIIIGETYDPV